MLIYNSRIHQKVQDKNYFDPIKNIRDEQRKRNVDKCYPQIFK